MQFCHWRSKMPQRICEHLLHISFYYFKLSGGYNSHIHSINIRKVSFSTLTAISGWKTPGRYKIVQIQQKLAKFKSETCDS